MPSPFEVQNDFRSDISGVSVEIGLIVVIFSVVDVVVVDSGFKLGFVEITGSEVGLIAGFVVGFDRFSDFSRYSSHTELMRGYFPSPQKFPLKSSMSKLHHIIPPRFFSTA